MLCLLLVGRKKEREKRKKEKLSGVFFPQGQTCLAACVAQDFHSCYVHLKADLRASL
jgi:hypothetical protein